MEGFDLRTDIRDPKTGELIEHKPYVMRISQAEGTTFERPPGSGKIYDPTGRLLRDESKKAQTPAPQVDEAQKRRQELEAMAKQDAEALVAQSKAQQKGTK